MKKGLLVLLSVILVGCVSLSICFANAETAELTLVGGSFTEESEDTYLLADTDGNNNAGSYVQAENFEYSADITFVSGNSEGFYIGAFVFGSRQSGASVGSDAENRYYVAEFCIHPGNLFFHLYHKENGAYTAIRSHTQILADPDPSEVYSAKITVQGGELTAECNGAPVNIGSVPLPGYEGGYIGLLSADSAVRFANLHFIDLGSGSEDPDELTLTGGSYTEPEEGMYRLQKMSYYNGMGVNRKLSSFLIATDVRFITPNAEGFYLTGLVFGADQPGGNILSSSENACYVLEFSMHPPQNTVYVQLYRLENGTFIQLVSHQVLVQQGSTEQPYHISLEVGSNKEIVFRFGEDIIPLDLGSHPFNELYTGGYVGIMTCVTEAEFSSVRIEDRGHFDPAMNFQSNLTGWECSEPSEWGNTQAGYTGTSSDVTWAVAAPEIGEGEAFEYSARVTLAEGAAGIVFGIADALAPAEKSVAFTVSGTGIRIVDPSGIIYERPLAEEEKNRSSYDLRVTLSEGDFIFYFDESEVFSSSFSSYKGGRLGLYVEGGSAGFNMVYAYKKIKPHLTSLEVFGAELDKPYSPDARSYYADVDYTVTDVRVRMSFDSENYAVKIFGKTIDSGEERKCLLANSGYNVIPVTIIDLDTEEQTQFFLNINCWPDMSKAYGEELRPQFHYTSVFSSYMNDPNGLVYNAYTGEYHLFHQSHAAIVHGYDNVENATVSWAHAVSRDLINWEERPLAITPDELGLNFSGSCVIDFRNDSGLFDESVPPGSRMMIFYASAYGEDQSQGRLKISMAYSKDNGNTWIKYKHNPVVPNPGDVYGGGFRDPKVFWYEDDSYDAGGIWVMLGVGNAHFFVSENLLDWEYSAPLRNIHGEVIDFECPDVFQLAVDDDPNNKKWVITGGGVFYMIGHFERTGSGNGLMFIPETDVIKPVTPTFTLAPGLVVTEHYATQSFNHMPDGRVVSMSWLIDLTGLWEGKTWQGAQGIPLENKLRTIDGEIKLVKYPIAELNRLRGEPLFEIQNTAVDERTENLLDGVHATVADITANIVLNGAKKAGFIVRKGNGLEMSVYYDLTRQVLVVDKTKLDERTSKGVIETEMHPLDGNRIELRILLDNICFDVFGNGEAAVSGQLFSSLENDAIEFFADGDAYIENITVYKMNPMIHKLVYPVQLDDLVLDTEQFVFSPDVFSYSVSVPKEISSVKVKGTFDEAGEIFVNGVPLASDVWSGEITLHEGENTVIVVAGEHTYTIDIVRETGETDPSEPPGCNVSFRNAGAFVAVLAMSISCLSICRKKLEKRNEK